MNTSLASLLLYKRGLVSQGLSVFLGFDGNTSCLLTCIPDLGAPGRLTLPSGPSGGSDWQELEHPTNCSFPTSHRASFFPPIGRLEGRGAKPFPSRIWDRLPEERPL